MTKRVVDDAMVRRFLNAHDRTDQTAFDGERRKADVRRGLEAALSEPEEIPVTEEMVRAGEEAGYPAYATKFVVSRIYRAMESVRRKSEKAVPSWDRGYWMHLRAGEVIPKCHRRKDDSR